MSSSDSDNDDVPEREVCEQLCSEFVQISGTDSACAMFHLQNRAWDLQKALNSYFEGNNSAADPNKDVKSATVSDNTASEKASVSKIDPVDKEPHRIRVLSWNIDGLDTNNLKNRTKGMCTTIKKENPHVVFLQEVVPATIDMIEELCPGYQVMPAGGEGYFTAIMLKLGSVEYEDSAITPFYSSKMGRNLMRVKAAVKGIPFLLMTSHLESTAAHAEERKKQTKAAFKEIEKADASRSVVFGGDLNMRDKELAEVGGLPDSVLDIWEVTGKRPEAKYTWDLTRNDNLEWNGKFRPKSRFDRLFMRHAQDGKKVKPVYFELVGIQRLESCKRFCSDHWGILAHFDKV